MKSDSKLPIRSALAAAALFGASTPLAKQMLRELPPLMLAALLYLGSGAGLWLARLARDRRLAPPRLGPGEWWWLAGAIALGGVAGPVLLMSGLASTRASDASLLLNLEAVLTAAIAWLVFREHAGPRIVAGMALIVAGGVVLAWPSEGPGGSSVGGLLAVCGACLCWALDNNLTRRVSAGDALFLAGIKGLAAGATTLALALALGAKLPPVGPAAAALAIGLAGYGVSLVLFVRALRDLGAARTGAYFSTAPFIGAAVAILLLHETPVPSFWLATALMAAGVWLHLTERHAHAHRHVALTHAHMHRHDAHHQHGHDFAWLGEEPHAHEHRHEDLTHSHPHYPDVHHRHDHPS